MTPADVMLVFGVGVLRIQDQDVAAAQELDQLRALRLGEGARVSDTALVAIRDVELQEFIGLVIREERDSKK